MMKRLVLYTIHCSVIINYNQAESNIRRGEAGRYKHKILEIFYDESLVFNGYSVYSKSY